MSQSAEVHSLELLRRLHAVLARFGIDAQTALGEGEMEIRHVQDSLADRLKYWRQQVDQRHEEVSQAKAALSHARAMSEDGRTGFVEQELALRKALQRARDAEDKVATVRRWQRQLPEFIKEFEGPARGLSGFLEADLRRALVLLDNKVAVLEAYLAIPPGTESRPSQAASPPPSSDEATKAEP
jgi:hypothetical protein